MTTIKWTEYGDSACFCECVDAATASGFAAHIRGSVLPGVTDCWAAFQLVAVAFDPRWFDLKLLNSLSIPDRMVASGRAHEIPVCYSMGEDLNAVCKQVGVSVAEFISAHVSVEYSVLAIGFAPGFAYLGPVAKPIAGVPRLPAPRQKVQPGSVAITEVYTAVYPSATPGGWHIVGRTPLCLVDESAGYFGISAGDRIRFVEIPRHDFEGLKGRRL